MLERFARWILRRQIVEWKIREGAAWNEGYQVGYRVAVGQLTKIS